MSSILQMLGFYHYFPMEGNYCIPMIQHGRLHPHSGLHLWWANAFMKVEVHISYNMTQLWGDSKSEIDVFDEKGQIKCTWRWGFCSTGIDIRGQGCRARTKASGENWKEETPEKKSSASSKNKGQKMTLLLTKSFSDALVYQTQDEHFLVSYPQNTNNNSNGDNDVQIDNDGLTSVWLPSTRWRLKFSE